MFVITGELTDKGYKIRQERLQLRREFLEGHLTCETFIADVELMSWA